MAAVSNFDPRHTQGMKGSNTEKGIRDDRPRREGSKSMNIHSGDDNNAELRLRWELFPSNPPSNTDSFQHRR